MFGVILLLLVTVPVAELFVIIKVGSEIGALNTLALLLAISVVGAWLVKRQGLQVLARAQRSIEAGQVPTDSLADGVLLLVAGALLLAPGFLSDVVGILLLLPSVRAVLRRLLVRRYRRRVEVYRGDATRGRSGLHIGRFVTVVDVEEASPPQGRPTPTKQLGAPPDE